MNKIILDKTEVSEKSPCYVIAEVGHNHQGNIESCKKLFLEAKLSGANAVKLQKRNNKKLYTEKFYNSPYDNPNSYGKTYGLHREFLEFNKSQYLELKKYAKEIDITFFATGGRTSTDSIHSCPNCGQIKLGPLPTRSAGNF